MKPDHTVPAPTAMASLISRLKNLGASSIAKGIVGTMMLKVASAIIAFSLFSLAANAAGAEEFGKFSVFFSVASMMSIVAAAGQELKVVRAWNQYMAQKQPALALGAVRYGWILTLVGTAIVAVVFGVFLLADLAITPLQIGGDWLLALATIAFMATNTIALFTAHLARAIVSIQVGDGHHELTWRSLVIAILLASLIMGHGITTTEIFAVSALGLMLVIAIQTVYINRKLALDVGNAKPDYDLKTWNPRSFRLWLASIMEASNQHLEVFMIGVLLHPLAAGAYFVASRLANAFALAADGINTFGTRRVPGLYFAGEKRELSQSLRLMALMSLAIVVGGVGTVLIAGDWLLLIFGRDYMAYYWVLVILSVGTAISAAVGPAPAYLKLTGHEAHYMSVVSGSVILRIIGFIVIIPYFGIIGAAIVTASILAVMSLYLNYQCRKQTGMDPSILCLFRDPVIEPTAKENASPPPEALAAE